MRKADRLSKRYFRVCSWNCASANRRGAVLEKMAIVVWSDLSKTVSLLNLDKWSG